MKVKSFILFSFSLCLLPLSSFAEGKGNQVFFRGAYSHLTDNRGGEVFTDGAGATTVNNGSNGYSVAAGLRLGLADLDLWGGTRLQGEIFLEYSNFSKKTVSTASSVLLGTPTSDVHVSQLNIAVSPQIRFEGLGRFRPFIAPIGLAFIVSSPPSNDTTYLDLGIQVAGGFDVKLLEWLSVGVDARYTHGFKHANVNNRNVSVGGYLGINF